MQSNLFYILEVWNEIRCAKNISLKFKNDSKCWLMLNIIKSNVCCFYLFFARKNEIKVGIGNVTIHVFIHTVIWEVLVQMYAWGWLVKKGLMFKEFVCNQHRTAWKGAFCIFWMWVFVTKGPIGELRKLKTTCMAIIFFLKAKVNRYIELYIQFIRIWNRSREFVIRSLSLLIHSLGLGIY